jgi:hypothetical protein
MKIFRIWLAGLLLLAAAPAAVAQNSYPVHVTVQVLPPYGVFLADYYSGTRDRLVVTLLNRDQGQQTLQVKLRVKVRNGSSFSMQSRDELYYPMITLTSGVPLRLTNADIVPYLAADRVAVNGYLKDGKLPTGMTEFSVQALDYVTGRPVSDIGTGRAWLEIKQPPFLDLPAKDEQVELRTPQYIRFQWMPRHQGVASTMYEFTLRELPDNGAAPQSAFLYGNPVYQTQTRFTTLNYTHLEPPLTPGKRYGWQVRAVALDGIDEIGMFENNGYSEIGWFQTSDNLPAPLNVTAQAGYRKMTLGWLALPEHTGFTVEYRPQSEHDYYEWTSAQTIDNAFTAYNLTPGWKYEYRVGARGMYSGNPVFSPTGVLTLPVDDEERLARCGMKPAVDLANQEPKENLIPGDVVIIGGDFPMTLTQVSPQGSGWYSGKGWLKLPWVFDVDVAVTFNRLRVNTDNRQIGGEVETEYDPEASQIANLNELDYGGNRTTAAGLVFDVVQLDFALPERPVAEYDPGTGELVIYDTAGEPHTIATKENGVESIFPMVVEDAEGNKYQIDAPPAEATAGQDATAQEAGQSGGAGGKQTPVVTPVRDATGAFDVSKLDANAGVVVGFGKGGGKYAFDAAEQPWYRTAQLLNKSYYPSLGSYPAGEKTVDYVAPWKFIPSGESDTAEAEIISGQADASKITFVLKDGKGVAAAQNGNKWTLTLPSVGAGQTYEVYALIEKGKDNFLTVGKLNVVSYAKQQRKVTLVPVMEQISSGSVTSIEQGLQRIYGPYGISVTVEVDDAFRQEQDWAWDLDGDSKLNLNGSAFFSNETAEMKALRQQYQRAGRYDKNGYYIFVLKEANAGTEPDADKAVQGDMPRSKQFGYVFTNHTSAATLPWVVAHELGHGIFTLTHTFDNNYSGDKYKFQTPNLMDYASGTDLAAFQWNVMANPAPLTWFDSDEDGQFFSCVAPRPNFQGAKEGQATTTTGTLTIDPQIGATTSCTETWYYHLGSGEGTKDVAKAGWYRSKDYCRIKYIEGVAHDLALAVGDVIPNKNLAGNTGRVESAENRLITEISSGKCDENFFSAITSDKQKYSEICNHYNLYYSGSGRVDLVFVELDGALLAGFIPYKVLVSGGKWVFMGLRTLGNKSVAQMAKLGYKFNVVGAEVVLCTELNVEIAKFGSKGLVLTNYIRNAPPATYRIVNEISTAYEVGGKSAVGQLKLWKTPENKLVWEIVGPRTIDHTTTSGFKLVGDPDITTTLLGRWTQDMEAIKELLLTADFNVGTKFGQITNNKGGFNFLNIPKELEEAAGVRFFEMYNKPWLDAAITRGDKIVLTTKPINKADFVTITGELRGNFAQELRYLVQRNYKPNNITSGEWANICDWFINIQ